MWPSVEFDFSHLGHTPIDEVIVNNNLHPHLEPIKLPYIPPSSNTPLPPTNPLVRAIKDLLYENGNTNITISKSDVENIGAICVPKKDVCVYHGEVFVQSYANGSKLNYSTIEYNIFFYLDTQPLKIEVIETDKADF